MSVQGPFRLESGLFAPQHAWNVAETARGRGVVKRRICVLHEPRDRGSEVGFGGIPELGDEWMTLERLLNDASLNALAAAVNQPDLTKTSFMCRRDVLLDDRCDVAWRERVQVEVVFDGDAVSHRGTAICPAGRSR